MIQETEGYRMEKNDKIRVPKQKRSKALTEHIMNTAADLFSEQGYYSVSSHSIADAAGISIGSFYSYFSDKKQLFLAILSNYTEQVNRELPDEEEIFESSGIPSRESLKKWIKRVLDAHRIKPGLDRQITILELDDPEIAEIVRQQEIRQVGFLEHWLQLCLKSEQSDLNTKAAATVINNAIEKNVHDLAYSKSIVDENSVLEALSEMISEYIRGLSHNHLSGKED